MIICLLWFLEQQRFHCRVRAKLKKLLYVSTCVPNLPCRVRGGKGERSIEEYILFYLSMFKLSPKCVAICTCECECGLHWIFSFCPNNFDSFHFLVDFRRIFLAGSMNYLRFWTSTMRQVLVWNCTLWLHSFLCTWCDDSHDCHRYLSNLPVIKSKTNCRKLRLENKESWLHRIEIIIFALFNHSPVFRCPIFKTITKTISFKISSQSKVCF